MSENLTHATVNRPLRVALLSTPRSGNTWLRQMLASALNLTEWAVHNPEDINWPYLPERVIIQLHWRRDEQLEAKLSEHNFRVVALSRHPLDVLLSILTFAQHDSSTQHWLAGEGGNEQSLEDANPLSPAFLQYAVGPRAAALLGVSSAWHSFPWVCRSRYEDLVENPIQELGRIIKQIEPGQEVNDEVLNGAAAQHSVRAMRSRTFNELFHVWQGRPGLWRELLPDSQARTIYDAHATLFAASGYTCEPYPDLQPARAAETWSRMEQQTQTRLLTGMKRQLGKQESRRIDDLHSVSTQIQAEAQRLTEAHRQVQLRCEELQSELQTHCERASGMASQLVKMTSRLAQFEDVQPQTLVVARKLQQFPRLFSILDSLLNRVRLPGRKPGPVVPATKTPQ